MSGFLATSMRCRQDATSWHVSPLIFVSLSFPSTCMKERWSGTIVRKGTSSESLDVVVLAESRPGFSLHRLLRTSHEARRMSCTPFVPRRPRVDKSELWQRAARATRVSLGKLSSAKRGTLEN